jgi:long-chain fatty acid transport protein
VNPNLSLSGDVQFTQWSVFKQVVIQSQNPPFLNYQGYRDSWMISVGGTYRLNDRWALRGGLGWDQTPVTDRYRTVSLPDKDRYMVGVGFGYRVTDTVSLDGAYQHSFAFSRATMNQSLNNTDPITHAVVLSGSYEIDVNILATSLRYQY